MKKTPYVLIGIAGTGMRGLVQLLKERGDLLLGTDQNTEKISGDTFLQESVTVLPPTELAQCVTVETTVIYSDAVPDNNVVRQAATNVGAKQLSYPEAVATLMSNKQVLAIAGTHGKTTTTALLSHVLIEQGFDPTVLIGATIESWGDHNARHGEGKVFVIEADEYRDHFLAYQPDYCIVVSLDFDHPDFFNNMEHVEASFSQFLNQAGTNTTVIAPSAVVDEHPAVRWPKATIRVPHALSSSEVPNMAGDHMRSNAALVVQLAEELGVERSAAIGSLATAPAVGRRLELLGDLQGTPIFSDYGHHPAEIAATLSAVRETHPAERIIALFEAHTVARLEEFGSEFVQAFADATAVHLVPTFVPPGREDEVQIARGLETQFVHESVTQRPTSLTQDWEDLSQDLIRLTEQADLLVGFSAGKLDQELRRLLTRKSA